MTDTLLEIPDNLETGKDYGFRYPTFFEEEQFRYCRIRLERLISRHGRKMLEGMNLDTGHECQWYLEHVHDLEPITVAIVPQRLYNCRALGKDICILVYSCMPDDEGLYRVSGRCGGRYVNYRLEDLSCVREYSR